MTAIVAVLNKHAVAIAADSAVTMGDTHKVVNSANKIFTLSKYHPVAVMTYSSAAFMGVPWDIIIKEYRKELGKDSFDKLKDYVKDFITFLHKRHFFCDEQTQRDYLMLQLDSFVKSCREELSFQNGVAQEKQTEKDLRQKFISYKKYLENCEKCTEFKNYTFADFKKYAYATIVEYSKKEKLNLSDDLCEAFFYYLSANVETSISTGLVFVGYGEKEIYPSLYPLNISLAVDKRLRYSYDKRSIVEISDRGCATSIIPFAQIDVTQTIVRGINPTFQDILYKVINNTASNVLKLIAEQLTKNDSTKVMAPVIQRLDTSPLTKQAIELIRQEMFSRYTEPLLQTVIGLDKEDMANMAESFISLTSLVRRMQPGEETVGGPVDVAVISKGDGFIWINRKHYFKPELNASFFQNYFRNEQYGKNSI